MSYTGSAQQDLFWVLMAQLWQPDSTQDFNGCHHPHPTKIQKRNLSESSNPSQQARQRLILLQDYLGVRKMSEIRISSKTKFSQTAWSSWCSHYSSLRVSLLCPGAALVPPCSGVPAAGSELTMSEGFQGRAVTPRLSSEVAGGVHEGGTIPLLGKEAAAGFQCLLAPCWCTMNSPHKHLFPCPCSIPVPSSAVLLAETVF